MGIGDEDEIVGHHWVEILAGHDLDVLDPPGQELDNRPPATLRTVRVDRLERTRAAVGRNRQCVHAVPDLQRLIVVFRHFGHLCRPFRVAVEGDDISVELEPAQIAPRRGWIMQPVDQRVLVGEERLGQRVAAGLFDEVIEHAPAHVTEPGRLRIAEHLLHPHIVHPGQGYGVGSIDVAHEAVADRQIDLGIG